MFIPSFCLCFVGNTLMATGKFWGFMKGLKGVLAMLVVQVSIGGMNIMFKLAKDEGMSMRVLMAYRYIFGSTFMIPLALIVDRNSRPPMTWKIFLQGCSCGFFGAALGQNLFAESLILTSPTFATAMANLIPAITFVLAVVFRMERLAIHTASGKAKVLGSFLSITGAVILTFYRGVQLPLWSTNINLLHHESSNSHRSSRGHMLGSILAILSCLSSAVWFIIQTKMSMVYPSCSTTAFFCISAAVQTVVYAMCAEKHWSAWHLGWNIKLLYVAYSGIWVTGMMVVLISWTSRLRGPLFVSSFYPVMLLTVAILGSLLLDKHLYLGSIIAAGLSIVGLYWVLWGKGKEMKEESQVDEERTTSGDVPVEDKLGLTLNSNEDEADQMESLPFSCSSETEMVGIIT